MKKLNISKSLNPVIHYVDGDYDFSDYFVKVKNTKSNKADIEKYIEENKRDFTNSEYDCTGSKEVRFSMKIKNGNITLHVHESYDF